MTATALVTKDSLNQMLMQADNAKRIHIIGRALVGLFERQTAAEQSSDVTTNDNGIGFASSDARTGSLTAKSYIARQNLVQWQIDQWMRPSHGYPRICKYARQLNEIAVEKRQRTQAGAPARLKVLRYELGMVQDSDDDKLIDPIARQIKQLDQLISTQQ